MDWTAQIGKQELVIAELEKGLHEADRLSLEELKRHGYPEVDELESQLETMFDKPVPTIKRGDRIKIDSWDYKQLFHTNFGEKYRMFVPYISTDPETGGKMFNLGMSLSTTSTQQAIKQMRKRGNPLFFTAHEKGRETPFWQHQTYSSDELPELLTATNKCYDGWRGHVGQILRKFKEVYQVQIREC